MDFERLDKKNMDAATWRVYKNISTTHTREVPTIIVILVAFS